MFPRLVTGLKVSTVSGLRSRLRFLCVVGEAILFSVVSVDFWVSSRKRLWHCLGPSEASGLDVFNFLQIVCPPLLCCTTPWVMH